MSRVTEALKTVYDNPPWPKAVGISKENFGIAKRELAASEPRDLTTPFGLRIVVLDAVPEGELHFLSFHRNERGEYIPRVDKIVNIGEPATTGIIATNCAV